MYGANRLAFGILMVWAAGFLFFFAFHPGGVLISDPTIKDKSGKAVGGERPVKNPAEMLAWIVTHNPGDSEGGS